MKIFVSGTGRNSSGGHKDAPSLPEQVNKILAFLYILYRVGLNVQTGRRSSMVTHRVAVVRIRVQTPK